MLELISEKLCLLFLLRTSSIAARVTQRPHGELLAPCTLHCTPIGGTPAPAAAPAAAAVAAAAAAV